MSSEEFAKELLMYSTARAATALGYKTTNAEVLETLSDVLGHYMKTISEKMKDNSEIAGRSAPGMPDLLHALEIQNSNWRTLRDFAFDKKDDKYNSNEKRKIHTQKWDQPFFIDVPSFPVKRRQKDKSSIDKKGRASAGYVPSHLPAFPPRHTWSHDPKSNKNKRRHDEKSNTDDNTDNKKKKIIVSDSLKQSISLIEDSIDEKLTNR